MAGEAEGRLAGAAICAAGDGLCRSPPVVTIINRACGNQVIGVISKVSFL